jgi:hypothetical protein
MKNIRIFMYDKAKYNGRTNRTIENAFRFRRVAEFNIQGQKKRIRRVGRNLGHITDEGTRDYDIKLNGRTVDVKTRNLTNAPKPYHFCNIPAYSIKQNCEFYFFVFIRRDKTVGWIVGYIDKQKFNNVARLYKSGEPSGYNFTFPVDSFQVIIRQLEDIKKA